MWSLPQDRYSSQGRVTSDIRHLLCKPILWLQYFFPVRFFSLTTPYVPTVWFTQVSRTCLRCRARQSSLLHWLRDLTLSRGKPHDPSACIWESTYHPEHSFSFPGVCFTVFITLNDWPLESKHRDV